MKTIEAFKCEFTGGVFEDERRAHRSEFNALLKRVGGSLPAMGSVGSDKIMEWLASTIDSEIYPTIPDKLREALDYFDAHLRKAGLPKSVLPSEPCIVPMPAVHPTMGAR